MSRGGEGGRDKKSSGPLKGHTPDAVRDCYERNPTADRSPPLNSEDPCDVRRPLEGSTNITESTQQGWG